MSVNRDLFVALKKLIPAIPGHTKSLSLHIGNDEPATLTCESYVFGDGIDNSIEKKTFEFVPVKEEQ